MGSAELSLKNPNSSSLPTHHPYLIQPHSFNGARYADPSPERIRNDRRHARNQIPLLRTRRDMEVRAFHVGSTKFLPPGQGKDFHAGFMKLRSLSHGDVDDCGLSAPPLSRGGWPVSGGKKKEKREVIGQAWRRPLGREIIPSCQKASVRRVLCEL